MRRFAYISTVLLAGYWLCLSGCGQATTSGPTTGSAEDPGAEGGSVSALAGKIEIDGSSTVYPISEAAATAFRKEFPDVKITVAISGTGGGFKRFTKGETDVSDASRPIKAGEFDQCKQNGVEFYELPVAYDGLTIVVNPENTWVEQLTVDQLKKIFRAEHETKTWQDVDANWPPEPIKVYAPGKDSGTFDYFREVIVGKDEGAAMRSDMSTSEDDNVLVTGVAGEKNAIGFFGAAYFFENKDKLKAVPIVNPDTNEAVTPTAETIEDGRYAPFSRPLFIYVRGDSMKRPEMKKFVGFYLDHAAELAEQVDYVALPKEVYAEAHKRLDDRVTGTHYLTADNDKRSGSLVQLYQSENVVNVQ